MSKVKKKRNKPYKGSDAANLRPTVTRVAAVNRSKPRQWLYEHKQFIRPALIALGVLFVIILLVIGISELLH